MKSMKTLMLGAGVLAISAVNTVTAVPALAADYTSEYVEDVSVSFPGSAPVIHIENMSGNKHVSQVNPVVKTSAIDFTLAGTVKCKIANNVDFRKAFAYFGPVAHGGLNNIKLDATMHADEIDVAYHEKGSIAEATQDNFTVPLNKIKQGHPALRVDALEELNKKLQSHLQGGGNEVDFWKQDQEIVLQRTVALLGVCGKNAENQSGYVNENATIQIKYKGDPAVNDAPVLNAQIANSPNQINNDLPLKLDSAGFQPNLPHAFGKCLPEQNPVIQINLQFSGAKSGLMDLKVAAVSNTYGAYGDYANFQSIPVNPQASKKINFTFPLIEMLSQDKYSYMAISNNKTWNHNMQLEARYKSEGSSQWSDWEIMDTAMFKHRCTPQVSVGMGGQGGKIGFDNGGGNEAPKLQVKPGAIGKSEEPELQIQMKQGGSDPKPELQIKKLMNPRPG